jgi:hypothetical protein
LTKIHDPKVRHAATEAACVVILGSDDPHQ